MDIIDAIIVFVLVGLMFLAGTVGSEIGRLRAESDWKSQAVTHKCAEFSITDTLSGTTKFKWKAQP